MCFVFYIYINIYVHKYIYIYIYIYIIIYIYGNTGSNLVIPTDFRIFQRGRAQPPTSDVHDVTT